MTSRSACPPSQPASPADPDHEVLRLRMAMLRINELVRDRAFSVPVHLALGHEAIAVAVVGAMGPADRLLLTHRNMHYNLAAAPSLRPVVDEYRLLDGGLARGRGGSMNLTNPPAGIVYTSSILGNCLPVAAGVAMGQRIEHADAVTIAVSGDGAIEEGALYETLVMAGSLQLPLMIVVENNQWSMHTRIQERRCAIDLAALAQAFAMDYRHLAGNDPLDYHARLSDAREKVLASRKPCIVEVALTTLGDYRVTDATSPEGRVINYHHGPAPRISIDDGALIEASPRDPVHVVAGRLPPAEFADQVRRIRQRQQRELK